MALFLPRRGGIQPQYRPAIAWSHPLARGLVMCLHAGAGVGGWIDLAASRTITTWTGSLAAGQYGEEFSFLRSTTQKLKFSTAAFVGTAFTIFAECNPNHDISWTGFAFPVSLGTAADKFARLYFTDTGTTALQYGNGTTTGTAAGPGFSFGSYWTACGVQETAALRRMYINGVAGSDNTTNVTGTNTFDRTAIGCYSGSSDNSGWQGNVRRVRIFNRALSKAEVLALTANPDAMLYTPRGVLYFLSSGASSGNTIAVPKGALTLTGLAPTVVATANQTVAVPNGALTLTGLAPTVTVGNAQTVAVPAGALTLIGNAPTVVATANQTIAVPAGSLSLTGNAPTVVVGNQQIVLVPAGVLSITGFAPVVIAGGPVVVSVPVGSLSLTGYAPTVTDGSPAASGQTAGGVRHKRRRYEIRGKDYFLTEHELSQVLTLVMKEEDPDEEVPPAVVKTVKKVAKAITAVPVVKPTYTAAPAYDALLADMTRQYQAAETLRQIAQQIQEKAIADDDQDIIDILRLIP